MTTHTRPFWYQKHEMLNCAAQCGFSVTESLFDDWIEKGLIGKAGAHIWPGRGSRAWWPQAQLTLFLDLLVLRQRTLAPFSLMQLCHLPVWRWLYWGNIGGVALEQVQRAIATWIDYQQKIPEKQVRRDITHVLRQYQGPKATDKRPLIDELTQTVTFQKPVDRDLLQHLLNSVVNAYPKKTAKGPVRAFMDVAECWSLMHDLCWKVVQNKDLLFSLPEALWEWARFFILIGPALMGQERLHLANDPVLGAPFLRQTVHSLRFQSCHAMLTWLGLAIQREIAPWHLPTGRFLDPEAWQQGEVTWTYEAQIRFSPLVLPGGKPIPYLCNTITLSYQERHQPFSAVLPFL